jgi:hypothetical protein
VVMMPREPETHASWSVCRSITPWSMHSEGHRHTKSSSTRGGGPGVGLVYALLMCAVCARSACVSGVFWPRGYAPPSCCDGKSLPPPLNLSFRVCVSVAAELEHLTSTSRGIDVCVCVCVCVCVVWVRLRRAEGRCEGMAREVAQKLTTINLLQSQRWVASATLTCTFATMNDQTYPLRQ